MARRRAGLLKRFFLSLLLQKGTGCSHNKCYNGGTCVDVCHGEMFYCHCPKLFRGKHCERPKGIVLENAH